MGLFDRVQRALGPEGRGRAMHYRCARCDESFALTSELDDPTCPYCDSDELRVSE